MMNRVVLMLDQPEYSALLEVATRELRNPADQARAILRETLQKRGLLQSDRAPAKDRSKAARQ